MPAVLSVQQEQKELCDHLAAHLDDFLEPTGDAGRTVEELHGQERSHFTIKREVSRDQILEVVSRLYVPRGLTVELRSLSARVYRQGKLLFTARIQPHGYGALSVFVEQK